MAKDANGNEIPEVPYVPQSVGLSDGPMGAAQKMYANATNGKGPMGLVSQDGTLSGVADEAIRTGLAPTGGAGEVTAVRDTVNGTRLGKPVVGGPDAEDIIFPGTPGEMRGHDDTLEGMDAELKFKMSLFGDNSKPPPKFYQDASEDFSTVGGRRGKELFQRAYGDGPEDGPAKLQGAVRESEVAQANKNEAMAKFYDGEASRATQAAATRKMAMEQDSAEMRMRQERMEKATQFYTDDLANKGQFWSKPENIVAAISFSLMPIFSSDPSIGVKLVNQAIQQDMEHRRQSAGMALGAMRSNLDGYHKIVGDRQAGEQLAEAEARRIAAMEVERISAKFESPISKAKAEAIIQDLRIKSATGYMAAYNQAKLFTPAKVQDPELFKRRTKGYEGAWASLNVPDVAPVQMVGAAVNGSVGGSPSLAGSGGPNGGYTHHVDPEIRGLLRGGAPASVAAKVAMNGRVPGSANMYNMLSTYLNREAAAKAGGVGYGPAFEKAKQAIMEAADKELAGIPGLAQNEKSGFAGRKATLGELVAQADIIRASEMVHARDPNKFFGSMRAITGDAFANKYEELVRTFQGQPGTPAEKRERARKEAVEAFKQNLSGQLARHYNDISGSAVTGPELPRLQASIASTSDFGFAYNWLKGKSVEVQDREKTALLGVSPLARMFYMTRTGVGQRSYGLPMRPMAGPAKPPEGTGEFNLNPGAISTPAGGQSMSNGTTRYNGR